MSEFDAKSYWNKIAEKEKAITPGEQWTSELIDSVVAELTGWIPDEVLSKSKLMDIGCGEGRLMTKLAPMVRWYDGVDISPRVLSVATRIASEKQLKNVTFTELSDERFLLPSWDDAFDVVISWTVFMHLPREIFLYYLKCIHMYLKSKGYFAFQLNGPTYHIHDLEHRFDHVANDKRFDARWYPEWIVGDYLEKTGFEIVGISNKSEEAWKARKR